MASRNNIKEAIVSYAVQKALIDYGNSAHEETYYRLYSEFALHFVDCYNNAETLRKVLIELLGSAYTDIVNLIKSYLGEFVANEEVRIFIAVLEKRCRYANS